MAIYRIHPEKDTTIWSEPTVAGIYGNAGRDEILEIGGYPDANQIGRSKRALLQFSSREIINTVNHITEGTISCSIKLYNATATSLPSDYTINAYPISESWVNGLGKLEDKPTNKTGVSWIYRGAQEDLWGTEGGSFTTSESGSKTVSLGDSHDLSIDVTNIVAQHYSGSIDNNGIILKIEDQFEDYTETAIDLRYFSTNTNTIYSPYLEFKWNDTTYLPGDLTELNTDNANIHVSNLKPEYLNSGDTRFRLSVRPTNPTREFTTTSIYLQNYVLPQNSFWSIVDEYSNDVIVDFDNTFTKISADSNGSYFDVKMDMFSPERYYKVLIKTTVDSNTFIFSDKNLFKVVRNG